jgi:hypothetical protein
MEKATTEEPTKFIQFGCWNNINKEGCLEKVMIKLNEYVADFKQDFIVVTGDNYYPQKEKKKEKDKDKKTETVVKEKKKEKKEKVESEPVVEKKKIIVLTDIDYGFQLLPKNIPIYTILGNHDLERFDEEKKNLFVDGLDASRREENKLCEIVTKQIETISALPNISYEFFKSVKLANNTLLLMIDTSIYENITDSNKYLPCYQKFAELNSVALPIANAETIDTLRAYQLTKIQEAIETNTFSNIIMAGHHPIQQLKLKKEADKIFTDIADFKVVLQEIYRLTSTSKFYYLCSDLHLYQEGTIHLPVDTGTGIMDIKQYIVGTGGTELDPMPLGNIGNDIYDGITTINECGFLACDVTDSEPRFTFITTTAAPLTAAPLTTAPLTTLTAAANDFSGGKRKRRSKKYKYGTRRRRRNTRKKHKKR